MTATKLRLVESSGLYLLSPSRTLYDYRQAVEGSPHVVGLTEVDKFHPQLHRVPGYRPVTFGKANDVAFLVRRGVRVLRKGKRLAFDAPTGRNVWIVWVTIKLDGETITVHLCHWLAHVEHHLGKDSTSWRLRGHTRTTRLMCRLVRRHGRRRKLSFFMGDINVDQLRDQGNDPRFPAFWFWRHGLRTIWRDGPHDRRLRGQGTHGPRPIDIIGHRRQDGRVKLVRSSVHPRRYSDHRAVEADYRIAA